MKATEKDIEKQSEKISEQETEILIQTTAENVCGTDNVDNIAVATTGEKRRRARMEKLHID